MQTFRITKEEEVAGIVSEILSILPQKTSAHILTLKGELGAGKTTFTKALAKELGVTEHVTSPTFVLMKKYAIANHPQFKTLVHIDAYRVEDIDEVKILHLEELYTDPTNIICIEWPEKIEGLIPQDVLRVEITVQDEGVREFQYTV